MADVLPGSRESLPSTGGATVRSRILPEVKRTGRARPGRLRPCRRGRDRQLQVTEFQAQGLPGNSQQEGGLMLTASGVFHHPLQQEPV